MQAPSRTSATAGLYHVLGNSLLLPVVSAFLQANFHTTIIMELDQQILRNRLYHILQVKPKPNSQYESKFWRGWRYEWDQYFAKVGVASLQGALLPPPPQPDFVISGMATLAETFACLDAYQKCYFANQADGAPPKDNIWWKDLSSASFPARSYDDHKKNKEMLLQRLAEAKARVEGAKTVVSKIEAERLAEVGAYGQLMDTLNG
ncbi:hypothetical protein FIBSPDRAFT_886891 [Athelia psychrophila]|uniref:Uncharacterized protein n=1 Tax=Athelia psychrophila TaxID=1759441 RepID=A0A166QCD7_9AGAM|nr:hypothetical protein FIBSPDRAFT_886891 [Fibularhizoctonia sp. CBS 109695]